MINHRYRIINELGAGGSGRVFLVEDILSNHAPRALKVLTNLPVPVPGGEDPFLTETSILLSLHHPHLVSLYDFDTVRQAPRPALSGCRFFTMEYVKGLDALNWVIGIPPGPDRTRTIRTLLAQCLSVLSYVHERGIIHSDIKPQNLLVSGEPLGAIPPVVKLTDFGFSRTEAASTQASARGTLEYDAPEVLRGETVDQRIDLYSVGATFYHLVEGHCPFESTDPVALIKKILTDDPAFASPLWSEMPAMLAVVQSLLKKDPKDRPSTAHEAFSMLGVEELADQESDAVKQLIVPFVGREAELRRIRSIVRGEDSHTGSERPTAILITGLEGMGKSRLLDEVIRTARISGLRVFAASAVGGGIPYSGVRSLLRTLNVEIRSFADFDGASLPEGSRIVERYLEESDATKDSTDVFRPRDRDATVEALARFVIGCASRIPMTLVADDLDAMDENSVQVLQTIARDMPPGRATLIATSAADSVWTHAAPRVVRLPLTDLALADVISLAHSVLGRNEAVEALGTRLREVLGGMPIVILEALRALQGSVNAEYLCKNIETALTVIDRVIPSDADKLLLNRFSGLTPEKRLLFAFLCCFELPAPVAFAERYLALHPARIRTSLHDMKAAGLIAFNEDESRVAVSIARLKRVVYESLGADRMNLHRMIVAGMNAFSVEPSIPDLQEMAHQYNEMGEPDKASKYLERAAVRVLSLQAYQRALDLISRATEAAQAAADPDRVMALQGWRADALLQAGRIKEAIDLGTSVLSTMSIPEELRHSLLRTVSLGRSRLGDFELAKEGLRELIAAARNEGERAELVQELVNIEINVGGFKKAEETCLSQLEVAEQLENDKLKGAIFTDLGIATFLQGRYDDAARHFRYALGTYELLADEAHVVSAITNVGNALNARGDSAAAIEQWRRALEFAADSGTLSQQAKIQNNLGIAYFNLRRYAEARASYTQSRETFQRLGLKSELTYTLTNLGEVMLADGDYGGALSSWTEALDLYDMMTDSRGLVETYLQLAELRIILGDSVEPERLLAEAHRHIEADGIDTFSGSWSFWCGMLHATKGDFSSALPRLREARALFESSGEQQKLHRCLLHIAVCTWRAGEPREAIEQLHNILAVPEGDRTPLVVAEACYVLGMIERENQGATAEKPLAHFKAGMQVLEREPISEVTWKMTYALAREFFERGQRERARQNLLLTEKVLRHFVSCIPTEDLRAIYLGAEGRAEVLSNIERHFRSSGE